MPTTPMVIACLVVYRTESDVLSLFHGETTVKKDIQCVSAIRYQFSLSVSLSLFLNTRHVTACGESIRQTVDPRSSQLVDPHGTRRRVEHMTAQ